MVPIKIFRHPLKLRSHIVNMRIINIISRYFGYDVLFQKMYFIYNK